MVAVLRVILPPCDPVEIFMPAPKPLVLANKFNAPVDDSDWEINPLPLLRVMLPVSVATPASVTAVPVMKPAGALVDKLTTPVPLPTKNEPAVRLVVPVPP